jgi:hypothetical protein
LRSIKDLNPQFHTEHWRMLDTQPVLKCQRLIFLIGLTQGTIKVLDDPQAGHKGERQALVRPSFSEPDVEVGRDYYG